MSNHIKKLVIYDFDGTICKSPDNTDENKLLWEKVTGREWGRKSDGTYKTGWWSKHETLDPDVFEIELVDFVKENAIKDIEDVNTFAVLMTGRMPICSKNVKEILRRHGVPFFNRYLFNHSYNTHHFKVLEMENLFKEFPSIEEYTLWEDRLEHIEEWGGKDSKLPSFRHVGNEWAIKTGGVFNMNIISKDYKLIK